MFYFQYSILLGLRCVSCDGDLKGMAILLKIENAAGRARTPEMNFTIFGSILDACGKSSMHFS